MAEVREIFVRGVVVILNWLQNYSLDTGRQVGEVKQEEEETMTDHCSVEVCRLSWMDGWMDGWPAGNFRPRFSVVESMEREPVGGLCSGRDKTAEGIGKKQWVSGGQSAGNFCERRSTHLLSNRKCLVFAFNLSFNFYSDQFQRCGKTERFESIGQCDLLYSQCQLWWLWNMDCSH